MVTTCFDRTKYNYDLYFFGAHYHAVMRRYKTWRDHPDDPRVYLFLQIDELETPNVETLWG